MSGILIVISDPVACVQPPSLEKNPIFPEGREGLHTGYDPVVILDSLLRRQHPCSGPKRTRQITGNAFRIFFQPNGQLTMPLFNRPILARTQILVHSWGLRTRSALSRRRL